MEPKKKKRKTNGKLQGKFQVRRLYKPENTGYGLLIQIETKQYDKIKELFTKRERHYYKCWQKELRNVRCYK